MFFVTLNQDYHEVSLLRKKVFFATNMFTKCDFVLCMQDEVACGICVVYIIVSFIVHLSAAERRLQLPQAVVLCISQRLSAFSSCHRRLSCASLSV